MQRTFRIPKEGDAQQTSAFQYVARAWPEGTKTQIQKVFDNGDVKADGILVTRSDNPLAPETVVSVALSEEGAEVYGVPDVETLLRGDKWVVVDKPGGIPGWIDDDDPTNPVRFMADVLGLDRDYVAPVWRMPTGAGGPWLVGHNSEVAEKMLEAVTTGGVQTTWVALTTRPPRGQGQWKTDRGSTKFAVSRTEGGLAELQLTPNWESVDGADETLYSQLLKIMAEAGFPAIGDPVNGGYLVDGGVRLRLQALYGSDDFANSWTPPRHWWPEEPVVVPPPEPDEEPEQEQIASSKRRVQNLKILAHTATLLERDGHPWILREALDERIDSFAPGDPVSLVGPSGASGFYAVVDGTGPIGARVWSEDEEAVANFREELEMRLDEAMGRRRALFGDLGNTDVFRVVHGEADGLPGLVIDRVGPVWRVSTVGRCALGFREDIYEMLQIRDPDAAIFEVQQLGGHRDEEESSKARLAYSGAGLKQRARQVVRDDGLGYEIELSRGTEQSFLPAHRDNRRRALKRATAGERWLDIRANTAGFSVALASSGIEMTAVDPQARYFSALEQALEFNGLPGDYCEMIEGDIFQVLDNGADDFDGILVDLAMLYSKDVVNSTTPRTPEQLLGLCFERLAPGGSMLVCRPQRAGDFSLKDLVQEVASKRGVSIEDIEAGPPASDFPTVEKFPEGDVFVGLWVRRGQ